MNRLTSFCLHQRIGRAFRLLVSLTLGACLLVQTPLPNSTPHSTFLPLKSLLPWRLQLQRRSSTSQRRSQLSSRSVLTSIASHSAPVPCSSVPRPMATRREYICFKKAQFPLVDMPNRVALNCHARLLRTCCADGSRGCKFPLSLSKLDIKL
jgi:hypothetical protein